MTKAAGRKRRTWALADARYDDLELIKEATDATTDTAALDEAISVRADFVRTQKPVSEIKDALTLWAEVKRQMSDGCSLVFESTKEPNKRTIYHIPHFG